MDPRKRRAFLTQGIGGLFAVGLGVPGAAYVIDPRNRPAAAGAFRRVAKLSDLTKDQPLKSVVQNVRRDAWTLHPNDVIGRVWLIWRGEKDSAGAPRVEAFTTICPHLGGSINFDSKAACFVCPLHGATFDTACRRVPEEKLGHANPAPRDMDKLDVQLVPDSANDGDFFIEVKYQNFYQGREEPIPKK